MLPCCFSSFLPFKMLSCCSILHFPYSYCMSSSLQMTAEQVCPVQQERTPAQPCLGFRPAVSSTPRVEAPPPVTCPWATPTQAACRRRPLSRPGATFTTTATLTTSSTMSTTLLHSPPGPCPFRSPAAPWSGPVLCPRPALESAAAAPGAAATRPTTTTRYAHTAIGNTMVQLFFDLLLCCLLFLNWVFFATLFIYW